MEYRRAFKLDPDAKAALDILEEIDEVSKKVHYTGNLEFVPLSRASEKKIDNAFALLNNVMKPQMDANEHEKTNDEIRARFLRTVKPLVYTFNSCVYAAKSPADAEECGERLHFQLLTKGLKTALDIANDY